jgi:hypothetical protein
MAKKVAKPVEAPAPDTGADDLQVLHPDGTVTIDGRTLAIRLYRFVPGMRVRAKSQQLVHDLQAQIESGTALSEEIMDVLAAHEVLVRELIVDAIEGADEEPVRVELASWVAGLDDTDGEQLMLVWWGVCGPFFLKTIVRRWQQARQLQADMAALHAGPMSMPASPPPATARPDSSDTSTPSGS